MAKIKKPKPVKYLAEFTQNQFFMGEMVLAGTKREYPEHIYKAYKNRPYITWALK